MPRCAARSNAIPAAPVQLVPGLLLMPLISPGVGQGVRLRAWYAMPGTEARMLLPGGSSMSRKCR
eukprot:2160795-Rhodomonas_salina.1